MGYLGAGKVRFTASLDLGTRDILTPRSINRITNLGCPRRHLGMENPKAGDILPGDDEVYNQGVSFPGIICRYFQPLMKCAS